MPRKIKPIWRVRYTEDGNWMLSGERVSKKDADDIANWIRSKGEEAEVFDENADCLEL